MHKVRMANIMANKHRTLQTEHKVDHRI